MSDEAATTKVIWDPKFRCAYLHTPRGHTSLRVDEGDARNIAYLLGVPFTVRED